MTDPNSLPNLLATDPPADSRLAGRLWMSALADGEAGALDPAAHAWRQDDDARQAWHTYHLIGDVLRSDELASPPARDAAFLTALRERLAQEPIPLPVLQPMPSPAVVPSPSDPGRTAGSAALQPRPSRLGWRAPAAVAAAFMLVAGGVTVLQSSSTVRPEARGLMAAAPAGTAAQAAALAASRPALGEVLVVNRPLSTGQVQMIRDARLDAYLSAHRSVRGGAAAALPGGPLRNVDQVLVPVQPGPAAPLPSR